MQNLLSHIKKSLNEWATIFEQGLVEIKKLPFFNGSLHMKTQPILKIVSVRNNKRVIINSKVQTDKGYGHGSNYPIGF